MRSLVLVSAVVLCAATAMAEEKTISIKADGAAVLSLDVPKSAEVTTAKGKTVIDSKKLTVYVWMVPHAKEVSDGVAHVREVISDEFRNFAIDSTKTITVAGSDAKHLMGRGVEADDGDAGSADAVVFTVGGHVFVACVHGEGTQAARERDGMLKVLASAKAP
jgi:hypothetical protein